MPSHGNTFEFYEVPQAATQTRNELSADRLDFEESPRHESQGGSDGQFVSTKNTEINNTDNSTNKTETNNSANEEAVIIQKPQVREITIKPPTAEGRSRPKPIEQVRQAAFEF